MIIYFIKSNSLRKELKMSRIKEQRNKTLKYIFYKYKVIQKKYKNFEKFKTVHFLEGSYIGTEDGKVLSFSNSSKNTAEEVIKSMNQKIYKRAEMIANSTAGAELFRYFEKYNLIETLNKQ